MSGEHGLDVAVCQARVQMLCDETLEPQPLVYFGHPSRNARFDSHWAVVDDAVELPDAHCPLRLPEGPLSIPALQPWQQCGINVCLCFGSTSSAIDEDCGATKYDTNQRGNANYS